MIGSSLRRRLVSPIRLRSVAQRCISSGEEMAAKSEEEPVVPKRRTLKRALPPPIILTDNAASQIKKLLERKPEALGIRLGVRSRGCNGLSYTMNYVSEKVVGEESVIHNGVQVFVEPKALFHVVGTTMDYEDTPVAAEFTFANPNSKGSCGCGESFNV